MAIREAQLDFGMRNAEALDHVFYSARRRKHSLQSLVLPIGWKMIVQFGIEAKVGAGRRESHIHMLALAEARRREVLVICPGRKVARNGNGLKQPCAPALGNRVSLPYCL